MERADPSEYRFGTPTVLRVEFQAGPRVCELGGRSRDRSEFRRGAAGDGRGEVVGMEAETGPSMEPSDSSLLIHASMVNERSKNSDGDRWETGGGRWGLHAPVRVVRVPNGTFAGMGVDLETITVERDGHVVLVTIDHPKSAMNAVDELLHRELAELFRYLAVGEDELIAGARAIVLTGHGPAFSAGGDMSWFPQLSSPDRLNRLRREGKQIIWDHLDIEPPIICALNGPAVGLGASIALMCDVIVMADTATLIDPHVKVGLVAGDGGAAIWPLLVGPLAAKRHLMLGLPLGADEALRLGIAAEVCDRADVATSARQWADDLAAQPPLAVQGTKISVNQQIKQSLLTSFDVSTALEMTCFHTDDHAEAVAAFVEKRAPHYTGS